MSLTNGEFSETQAIVSLSNIACNGSELSLMNCNYDNRTGLECGPREDAGVVCQRRLN